MRRTDTAPDAAASLRARYDDVRARSLALAKGLSDADATVQSMPDASPTKWHLAHTSWFFEAVVLDGTGYEPFDPRYAFLFNSYYEGLGPRHARAARGMLSRPSLDEVLAYRKHVDAAMQDALGRGIVDEDTVALGLDHEGQHQELLLTDILHAFAANPLEPAYRGSTPLPVGDRPGALTWTEHPGGIAMIGTGDGFDCEGPRHEALLPPHAMADRAVTCGEWRAFMADGGYDDPLLWLSDGWAVRQREGWTGPAYWQGSEADGYTAFSLRGRQPVDDDAPVSHVSFYEADAYASWAAEQWPGARLPTEMEWETAASGAPRAPGEESGERLRPAAQAGAGPRAFLGGVWEWTASAYLPYPGFVPAPGPAAEYNGKFMSGQMVLRGGSCLTPPGGAGVSTRNFFPPAARWQMTGLRLARTLRPA